MSARPRSLAGLPGRTLAAGTIVYHGTDCAGDFEIPDDPPFVWLAPTFDGAAYWAGWNVPAMDYGQGERRVHSYVVTADVELVDLCETDIGDGTWLAMCEALTGSDDELDRSELAAAFLKAGRPGWIWGDEMMLTAPAECLRFVGRTPVPGKNPLRFEMTGEEAPEPAPAP